MSVSRWERWGPIAGIVFVVLLFVGVNLSVADLPSADDSLTKISNFYNDGGKRAQVIIGAYLLWLAGVFFIWFLASVRTRLLAVEGAPGRLTSIAFGGGLVFVAMLMVAAACFASVAGDITFGGEKFVSPDAARFIPEIGYPIFLIGGMFAAIAMIDAVSILILRTGMLPKWIGWFGFFAAVVLLGAVFFIPIVAFLLWVLFISVAMLRSQRAEAVPPATAIPPG
jgi:hypothetical protein